jgi:hypothetical protein
VKRHAISALSAAAVLGLTWPTAAQASCVPSSPEQQRQRADVIFVGVALQGPTAMGVQRFRVGRYLKGTGPGEVGVATGVIRRPDGSGETTSVSVEAAAGERWRIYGAMGANGRLETNQCAGSSRLASVAGEPPPSTAPDSSRKALILGASLGVAALLGMALGFRRRARRSD